LNTNKLITVKAIDTNNERAIFLKKTVFLILAFSLKAFQSCLAFVLPSFLLLRHQQASRPHLFLLGDLNLRLSLY
jgi:hypothetical protein